MQTVDTMIPISPDTSPSTWESGPVSAEKAIGLPSVEDTWMAVMKNMAAPHEDVSVQAGPPSRPGGPMQTETVQKQATPEAGESKAAAITDETGISLFIKTITSTAVPATPEKQFGTIGPQITHPEPVVQHKGEPMAETMAKNGPQITPLHEGQPAMSRFQQPAHDVQSPAPEPLQGAERYLATNTPDGKQPIPEAPQPSRPIAPIKTPSQSLMPPPADQHPQNQQPEKQQMVKQHPTNLTESMLPDTHLFKGNQKTATRTRPLALAKEGSEKQLVETGRSLPGRPEFLLPRTATSGTSFEIGRSAPSGDHAQHQHSATAIPTAGRHASVPSMTTEILATGTALIRDEGTVLRIEHPLWSNAGTTEMPIGEDARIRPDANLPPATREMRILSDVIEKAYWHQDNGRAQARIQIKPAFLGHLLLNVLTDQSRVSVEIRVENPLIREFIEMNLQALKTDLHNSGLEIDKINVIVDPDMDNHRDQYREPGRKQNRRFGAPADMAESATADKKDHQNTMRPTDDTENSINYFA